MADRAAVPPPPDFEEVYNVTDQMQQFFHRDGLDGDRPAGTLAPYRPTDLQGQTL